MFQQLRDPNPPVADDAHLAEVRRRAATSLRKRRIATASVLAVALAGATVYVAGLSDDTTTRTIPPATAPSTEGPPTTTATETTSTTITTTTTEGAVLADRPPISTTTASGSGCSPGADQLPDGWWYGSLRSAVGPEVSFDLACYYVGDAAEAEAAARGDEVNNDYYVVNESPQLRTIAVAESATASCVGLGAGVTEAECDPSEVGGDDVQWAVWLRVQDGEVNRIFEQYAP